jgi:hypothetical protein
MSKIMTLSKIRENDENKLKSVIHDMASKIKGLEMNKHANKKVLSAFKEHILQLRQQLKDLNEKPKIDFKDIIKTANETIIQDCNFSQHELKEIDDLVNEELKFLQQ